MLHLLNLSIFYMIVLRYQIYNDRAVCTVQEIMTSRVHGELIKTNLSLIPLSVSCFVLSVLPCYL